MDKIIFKETQSSRLLVIMAVLLTLLFSVIVFIQMILGIPVGNHPAPNTLLVIFFVAGVLSIIITYRLNLRLIINKSEIRVRFGILGNEKLAISDIKELKIRKYNALQEFMGWGVRYKNNERCFTVSGDDALEIELKNGEKFLIGTQKPDEIMLVITKLLPNS